MDDLAAWRSNDRLTPRQSAEHALAALRAYCPDGQTPEQIAALDEQSTEGVADLITDLLHLVAEAGWDAGEVMRSGINNFAGETAL
ncbi:hypothetical protein WIS52_19190 [Pseudonocardia nematodicida]|uniref:Uncharacterized protein n=1 Tax=Pseudonocardia nematodicida TaxID=1206997 RepID=A0ABV1KFC9_9PSEU